jgi:hypothetical protein
LIEAVDGFVADQNHSGAGGDVLVIRDIDSEFGHLILLDPAMEDRNGVTEAGLALRCGEEFYAEMLNVH